MSACAACCAKAVIHAQQVEAVIALQPARIDQVPQQLAAVRAFMALPEAESLAAANKRIGNILRKADDVPTAFDRALLLEPAERSLGEAFSAVRPWAEQLYASGDYSAMLKSLAPLKLPVDRFFDEVMVNVDDAKLRANRLGLLAALQYHDESSRRHLEAQQHKFDALAALACVLRIPVRHRRALVFCRAQRVALSSPHAVLVVRMLDRDGDLGRTRHLRHQLQRRRTGTICRTVRRSCCRNISRRGKRCGCRPRCRAI